MNDIQIKTCDVCNIGLHGEYCHNCGQKVSGKRLNIYSVIQDLASNILSIEKSVFGTTYQILRSPSKIIENYLNGNRRYYSSPFKLVLYASLFIGLHLTYNENLIFGLRFSDDPKIFFIFLFLIIFTLSSCVLYYKRKYNLLEISCVNVYIFSALTLILIPLFELIQIFDKNNETVGFTFIIGLVGLLSIYNSIILSKNRKWLKLLTNTLLHFIIFFLIIFFIIFISAVFGELEIDSN